MQLADALDLDLRGPLRKNYPANFTDGVIVHSDLRPEISVVYSVFIDLRFLLI